MSRRSVACGFRWGSVIAVFFFIAVTGVTTRVLGASDDSITSPDTDGIVGWDASLALDGSGNPVVSHLDFSSDDLKLLHCDDPNCADGNESITSPDTSGDVGRFSSLALDENGHPVVAYLDLTNDDLKVLHCDDPNCAGGGESITSPVTAGLPGGNLSLVLDGSGHPVVAYFDFATIFELRVLHCDDPNCAGGGESITSPDPAGGVGGDPSVVLDEDGNPVVAYLDFNNADLKVLHCDDPNCAGGGESITSPDTAGDVGGFPSLALDEDGNPVVAYLDFANDDLKVLHCDDPNCAGGGESITSPDTDGDVGHDPSLALDENGNPVVAYGDLSNGDLKILHCDDPICAGGGESITSPDIAGFVGGNPSLMLDVDGNPVVAYLDFTNGDLKILHCDDPNCADNTPPMLDLPDLVFEASGPDGATVNFEVTATDADDPNPVVVCDPEPGTVFAIGETVVECTATDNSGNSSTDDFVVTVVDTTPPALMVPDDMAVAATGPDGAVVDFEVTASDLVDPDPQVGCDPSSGSKFAPGQTEVECTASDASGNTSTGRFIVAVVAEEGFRFEDVPEDHEFDMEIHWMAEEGITFGCNPPANTRFCPGDNVTRGQMAAFLVRALRLQATADDGFVDTAASVFQEEIARLAAAGITRGCNPPDNDRFCPTDDVTRGQMAAFLVRALGLSEKGQDFEDTVGHVFQNDISHLRVTDITRGCNPPSNTRYCPDDPITRGQMAAFIYRALQLDL